MAGIEKWLGDSSLNGFARIGAGKSAHLSHGNDETLCGKLIWGDARGQYITLSDSLDLDPCRTCWTRMEREVSAMSCALPGDSDTVSPVSTTTATREYEMANTAASKAETAAKYVALRQEIAEGTERIVSLATEGNIDGVAELTTEIDALIVQLPSRERAKLSAALKAAGEVEEPTAEVEVPAPSTEIAIIPATYSEVAGVVDLVNAAASLVRDQAATAYKGGKSIARTLLSIRTAITGKDGLPDLLAKLDISKKASAAVYSTVTNDLPDEGTDDLSDIVRRGVVSVKRSAQTAMVDERVEYIRELDSNPAEAAKFAKLTENAPEGTAISELVAAHYKIELKTRAELEKERREAAQASKAAKGEADTEGGENEGEDSEEKEELSPEEIIIKGLKGVQRAVKPLTADAIKGIEDDEVRANIRKALKAAMDMFTELYAASL